MDDERETSEWDRAIEACFRIADDESDSNCGDGGAVAGSIANKIAKLRSNAVCIEPISGFSGPIEARSSASGQDLVRIKDKWFPAEAVIAA